MKAGIYFSMVLVLLTSVAMQAQDLPNGAWESNAGNKKVMIVAGNVFSVVVSDAATNDFISTYGGVVKPEKGKWLVSFEFNIDQLIIRQGH